MKTEQMNDTIFVLTVLG